MYAEGVVNSIKVFSCYILLIVALPSLIVKPKIREENIFKRFIIYLVFGNFYISSIVFVLAYLNIFNKFNFISSIVILSISIRAFLDRKNIKDKVLTIRETFDNVVLGKYGLKLFIYDQLSSLKRRIKMFFHELIDGKKLEWLIFLSIISYNVYQYGINSLKFVTYMAPDEEVHLYWIQSLLGGDIFPSGIYPHVFHNIVASLIEIFGFNGIVALRYFGATSIILIMTMLYFGLRKIFNTKYPALFGILMYSITDIYYVQSIYRFQFTVPQEYGVIMLMPTAILLFDYIKDKKLTNLIFFGMSLSLTVGIHFYTGIIGVILTLSIVTVYIHKIIKTKILSKLILCGILSAIISILPLAVGLALGHEMEQSINWASEVIKGDIYKENAEDQEVKEKDETLTWNKFILDSKEDITKYVVHDMYIMYIFLGIAGITIVFDRKNSREKKAFALNTFILVFLMLFRSLKLPTIMETKRLAIFFAYFSAIWWGMPLEIIIKFLKSRKVKKSIPAVSIGTMGLSIYLVLHFGLLRSVPPFYYFQTTGTMITNMRIMKNYEDYTWTAVSPVNNISAVLNHGFHYELSDFIRLQENWNNKKEIRIPTEYVFIYIEKRPLVGFGNRFNPDDPEIVNREKIKKEDAYKSLSKEVEENFTYKNERDILMAKAYYWAKEYKKYFPNEMNVYYEDSELIVYRVKQNIYAINNFNIDYGMNKGRRTLDE